MTPFNPSYSTGVTASVTSTPSNTTLQTGTSQVCLTNLGFDTCYVRVGRSTNTFSASAADMPILSGSQVTITKAPDEDRLSSYSAGTASLHVICGRGI